MYIAAVTEFTSNFSSYLSKNTDRIRKETCKYCLGK